MSVSISVVVPVGPHPAYLQYLEECLDSIIFELNPETDEIILVDDAAHLTNLPEWEKWLYHPLVRYYPTLWLSGCATCWNYGVSLAKNDLVLLAGSDDRLLYGAVEALKKSYISHQGLPAWYNLTIILSNGEIHNVFNNAAAVTKKLWAEIGGFPLSAGVGAPDALLISIMMIHFPDRLLQVEEGTPYYWCRIHPDQDTPRQAGTFNQQVIDIRNIETARWTKPNWTEQYGADRS